MYDKQVVRSALLTFGQCPGIVTDEGIVRGNCNGMPHGKIDLVVGKQEKSLSPYILCMVSGGFSPMSEPNSATVKSPVTFEKLQSGKFLPIC